MRGWHIKTGRTDGMKWYHDFTIYFGDKLGSKLISFHFPLHNGWQSHPRWMRGGWAYYEPAILTGRLGTQESKWHRLGRWLVPAKLVDLWRMRKKSWRVAMKAIAEQQPPTGLNKENKSE